VPNKVLLAEVDSSMAVSAAEVSEIGVQVERRRQRLVGLEVGGVVVLPGQRRLKVGPFSGGKAVVL
jgi:hypothetical protein